MRTGIAFLLLGMLGLSAQEVDHTTLLLKHKVGKETDIEAFHSQNVAVPKKFQRFKWSTVNVNGEADAQKYRDSGLFEKVQFDTIYRVGAVPDDPLYSQLWALAKIQAAEAWNTSKGGTNIVVAVIDTGVDYSHPDLRDNLWTGPHGEHGYTASRGFIEIGGQDDHSHGTHVAGTIGAAGNNSVGLCGVNWKVQILSLKFLSGGGFGSSRDAALCIDKMIELKDAGYNIRVSNNSWGALVYDSLLEDAFLAAENAGILNICAAGNNGFDTDFIPHSPASLPLSGIVSVLASDGNDRKAGFSNYGFVSTDLLAPGVSILSCRLGGNYWLLSGTSMAAPHVAGVCAAMFGLNPSLSPVQCKTVLLDRDSYDQTSFQATSTGGGRLNFAKALNNPKILNPPPADKPPKMTIATNLVILPPGHYVTLTPSATDEDGDELIYGMGTQSRHMDDYLIRAVTTGLLFDRYLSTNTLTITNIPSGREFAVEARFNVSDGRGGADVKRAVFFTERDESLVRSLPKPTLSIVQGVVYPELLVEIPGLSQDEAKFAYNLFRDGQGFGEGCCFPINTSTPIYGYLPPGITMFRVQVMDTNGNFVNSDQLVIDVGDTGAYVPDVKVTVNTNRGVAPLHIVADMRQTDPTGKYGLIYEHAYWRAGGVQVHFDIYNPIRTFTLTEPGLHAVEFFAIDRGGVWDAWVELFTVLPPDGSITPEPELPPRPSPPRLVAPRDLSADLTAGRLRLRWTSTSTGEDRCVVEVNTKTRGQWSGFRTLATLPGNSTSFAFSPQRAQYQFRVKACKADACSPYSNTASLRVR